MKLETIGENIRRYRNGKKLRQEDLAELVGVSTNYIGSLERGEKIPSLETFITIVNCLGVSSDMLLADVVDAGYAVKASKLSARLEQVNTEERQRICAVVETLLKYANLPNPR